MDERMKRKNGEGNVRNTAAAGKRRGGAPRVWIPAVMMAGGLLIVGALIYDMQGALDKLPQRTPEEALADEMTVLLLQQDLRVYGDSQGRFTMRVPPSWSVVDTSKNVTGYDVIFRSPQGFEMNVMVNAWTQDFATLERDVRQIQEQYGLNMNIARTTIHGQIPAVRRMVNLHTSRVITFDFVQDGLAHHVQISIPHRLADEFEPFLSGLFTLYQARETPPPADGDDNTRNIP